MRYRAETPVNYSNTHEYRRCLRTLFEMDQSIYEQCIRDIEGHNQETMDDESRDEMAYDDLAASHMMDYVYGCTKDVPEFMKLYVSGASRMFSEDPNIGIAIMFSYDYFLLYHPCLVKFYSGEFTADFGPYRELVKRLN